MVKSHRLFRGLQRNREFGRAGGAEIVGHAADGDDQRIIGDGARRRDLAALVVMSGAEAHRLRRAVEADHLAEVVAEVMPVRLGEIIELVLGRIHAARRDRVQQRLPQMRAAALDERDIGEPALAQPVAEMGDELEARGSAADDDDSVRMLVARRRHEVRSPLLLSARAFEERARLALPISPASRRIG